MSTKDERKDLIKLANQVHLAYTGELIPAAPYALASDHPFDGYDIDIMSEMIDSDKVKKCIRSFEKELKNEIEQQYNSFSINCPVKITKGSKEKRGIEGFILYAKEPLQGSGKALFVYDVITHKSCMVRSSATKLRLPKPGERDLLNFTYSECEKLADQFKTGTKVKLRHYQGLVGVCITNAALNENLDEHGFVQVKVRWDNNQEPDNYYTLTELELI